MAQMKKRKMNWVTGVTVTHKMSELQYQNIKQLADIAKKMLSMKVTISSFKKVRDYRGSLKSWKVA